MPKPKNLIYIERRLVLPTVLAFVACEFLYLNDGWIPWEKRWHSKRARLARSLEYHWRWRCRFCWSASGLLPQRFRLVWKTNGQPACSPASWRRKFFRRAFAFIFRRQAWQGFVQRWRGSAEGKETEDLVQCTKPNRALHEN